MKLATRFKRLQRGVRHVVWALRDRHHPLLVHIVPTRRCNLACAYCNEYDHVSQPVPVPVMHARVDKLADLGTTVVTISGGEPLMHPEIDAIVARIRERDMFATLITNGYYLSVELIQRLNQAGLDHLQISIDNVEPDEVSLKSLRLLEPKLQWLVEHRNFSASINSVLGAGVKDAGDALRVADRARELGLSTSVGLIHDGTGQLRFSPEMLRVYRELRAREGLSWTRVNASFQAKLARGLPNEWSCRAGARYLYVDEHGLVHYCSQQRGTPGLPLERYTREEIAREYDTPKSCAPFCTVNCVQQVAWVDRFRAPQLAAVRELPGFGPVAGAAAGSKLVAGPRGLGPASREIGEVGA